MMMNDVDHGPNPQPEEDRSISPAENDKKAVQTFFPEHFSGLY